MGKRIGALVLIFICTSFAWFILGAVTHVRTFKQDETLKKDVGQLWGKMQQQQAPYIYYLEDEEYKIAKIENNDTIIETKIIPVKKEIIPAGNEIIAKFGLQHRKKGLLWYATYRVDFNAEYIIGNSTQKTRPVFFEYRFPTSEGIYDNFKIIVDDREIEDIRPYDGKITHRFSLNPGENSIVRVCYGSQGIDEWWYIFGPRVSQIRNFKLTIITDFADIDFPENSISPTAKIREDNGWKLTWQYDNLISGIQIGLAMPQKLNPGPFVSRISFFAPVSLFLFMFLMFITTTIRDIKIHPMNYFFVAAAFFSFHLLIAYLADHINIHTAFAISSVVSIALVISYVRLAVRTRFALVEAGISQFIYLVLFSYAFFLEGLTGLSIAILCILTLFFVMQFTGRIDWEEKFAQAKSK